MDDIGDMDETFTIIIKPNSPKTELKGFDKNQQAYRLDIKAAPEKGKANQEVIRFFAKKMKKHVKIISGLRKRKKVLKTTNI